MPLFYFNMRRGVTEQQDPDGTELETVDQACAEAVQMLSDMAREEFPRDGDRQRIDVEVYDAVGVCVARAAISLDLDRMDKTDRTPRADEDADR